MGRHGYLIKIIIIGFIIKGLDTEDSKKANIKVKKEGHDVVLECPFSENLIAWTRDGNPVEETSKTYNLGPELSDPKGIFQCNTSNHLQVYFRMCGNCIELDAATISGIIVADVIATAFLAIAVYYIAGQDSGRLSRASDRQNLIASEQLYQPLGERDNEQYSRLGAARTRK
nr:T-cell surface glycoprotein CD3 gamma chain-like isoform X2 [Pelodiscus sinensis]XP_025039342.1 T-cell surface glycoprotein CD3 gamma chain-like isoform X1 [Pelodiscus sinensis]|eukprot:XP_014427929.1 T-cell surface glycoprotein CD3 gamma chain-like isoform X2 [Pelodiscus sinensis]